ncbi:MAG: TIGR01459 family HAD-type hydrolase [Paracoccaceae bacterium]|nr:TIGR01459 family HAD-type hydrolase [Paracoccaceae bacterium]
MTHSIESLAEIASSYDVIVLDQWGVLHDGTKAYEGTIESLTTLASQGHRLAVLSNSGKSSRENLNRIIQMGFSPELFETVMTSGEALWQDINRGKVSHRDFFPIERQLGDALYWAKGLDITINTQLSFAQAILLMGLPDDSKLSDWQSILHDALQNQMTVYCSNPDMASPRGEESVISPGVLSSYYQEQGGKVVNYGKPYHPIFLSMQRALGVKPNRLLMVGDSLDHDIKGAHDADWDSLFVIGGLNKEYFAGRDHQQVLSTMTKEQNLLMPTYMIQSVK